ncbi:MAG: hypothetical protein GQ557_01355 [Mycoplasmataceae bacterium]|nr:hypothetical protein [Mycoplasmataceae bacterium]
MNSKQLKNILKITKRVFPRTAGLIEEVDSFIELGEDAIDLVNFSADILEKTGEKVSDIVTETKKDIFN